jgi:type VI secretion system secreted protein VgrG
VQRAEPGAFYARIEDHAGRKEERGEGFELRTDGHGVLRAARGMLITTEARPNAANHALDMGETTARLARAPAGTRRSR